MAYDPATQVFSNVSDFFEATTPGDATRPRIVHCINPFQAPPESEHHRAQEVTLASMARARNVAHGAGSPVDVTFAKITHGDAFQSPLIDFHQAAELERSILDLGTFAIRRPLPLIMDILMAPQVAADDILIFTNVDIAVAPDFYGFVAALFARGADCAIINRRTISGAYHGPADLPIMACDVGTPHPGFDCFAMKGALRDDLMAYDSCVGIGGVMLPLVHQLLAGASKPVVLLDAHASFHLGDDKTWIDPALSDYTEHNRSEIDRVFSALIEDPDSKNRLTSRLSGAHRDWVFPNHLRQLAGVPEVEPSKKSKSVLQKLGLKRQT